MEKIISQIIDTTTRMEEEYLFNTLRRYKLITGKKEVYDLLEKHYNSQLNIQYSEFLSKDYNIYLLDHSTSSIIIQPINLVYNTPRIEKNPVENSVKMYCEVYLEAGGCKL